MVEKGTCLTQHINICFKPTNTIIRKETGKLYCLQKSTEKSIWINFFKSIKLLDKDIEHFMGGEPFPVEHKI